MARLQLALIHFPITLAVIPHLQQPVFRIVTLAAAGANQVPAPVRALVIVVLRDCERRAATAGNQKHPGACFFF